ncbi:hypothetical protein N8H22_09845 [Stutzerimonas stutzeri]|uniref:hypothetical protein n=1 Tax=Stutzerimonas sp. S1 TaxID=3030652 RepID=UPI00222456F0|nr:hypothetical protein [Stutzerimonas sp. S1]MCW3148893.1 hypothetical protein [Stutzerimonas sp. S1]
MNTVKNWMKTGCTLGFVFLTGEAVHAEQAQPLCRPTSSPDIVVYGRPATPPAQPACTAPVTRPATAAPRLYQGHVIAEPASGRALPRAVDERRYSF